MSQYRRQAPRWPRLLLLAALAMVSRLACAQNNAPSNGAPANGASSSAAPIETDVVYGEAGGQKLLLDVYRPAGPAKVRPAVLAVHGGGWSAGDKREFRDLGIGLARLGYVCFSINYRLVTATANKYPAQLDDVQRAVRWVRANADKYAIDPNRVGALGASAGGHLVALLGTRDTRDNSDPDLAKYSSKVNCVVDLFGPTDFTVPANLSGAAAGIVLNFLGKTPQEAPELYREASPVTHVDKNSVPFLIFHGTLDPLVPLDQSQRLYDALHQAGVEATFIKVEDGHGFTRKENIDRLILETGVFFSRQLHP